MEFKRDGDVRDTLQIGGIPIKAIIRFAHPRLGHRLHEVSEKDFLNHLRRALKNTKGSLSRKWSAFAFVTSDNDVIYLKDILGKRIRLFGEVFTLPEKVKPNFPGSNRMYYEQDGNFGRGEYDRMPEDQAIQRILRDEL